MKHVTITLTVDELNVVLVGLGKLPLEVVLNVFGKIKAQAEAQVNPPVEPEQADAS
jgi:hypothetical protein